MPGSTTHILGGLITGAGLWWALRTSGIYDPPAAVLAGLTGCVVLGALFPDVDTDSRARRLFYGALFVTDAVLLCTDHVRWAALLGLVAMLPALGSHRGWTHRLWAAAIVPGVILGLAAWLFVWPLGQLGPYYGAAVVGYVSHLVLDRLL